MNNGHRLESIQSSGVKRLREADASFLAVGVPKLVDVVRHVDGGHRFRIHVDSAKVFDVSVHSVDEMKRRMVKCESMAQAARATQR